MSHKPCVIDIYDLLAKFSMDYNRLNSGDIDTDYFWGYYHGINDYVHREDCNDIYEMGYKDGRGDVETW